MSAVTPMSEHERFYVPNRPVAKMNPLLVRSDVGLQRRSTYKLPPADFCYGKPGGADAESAGAIALNWVGYQPNAAEQGPRNFVKLNRDATVSGCVNATQATRYRDTHDARIAKAGGFVFLLLHCALPL